MTKPRPKSSLSPIGAKVERLLDDLMIDMSRDIKAHPDGKDRRYTLTDHMKIADRVLKIEAIKARIKEDDDGAFFNNRTPDDEGAMDET